MLPTGLPGIRGLGSAEIMHLSLQNGVVASFLYFLIVNLPGARSVTATRYVIEPCEPRKCGMSENLVSFPFWIRNQHADYCGLPDLGLTCNADGDLLLPLLGEDYAVKAISYENRTILLSKLDILGTHGTTNCSFPTHGLTSAYEFRFEISKANRPLFSLNCSKAIHKGDSGSFHLCCSGKAGTARHLYISGNRTAGYHPQQGVGDDDCQWGAVSFSSAPDPVNLLREAGYEGLVRYGFLLDWNTPRCLPECSASGGRCGFRRDINKTACVCQDSLQAFFCTAKSGKSSKRRNLAIGFSVAASLLLLGCCVGLLVWRRRVKRLGSSIFRSISSEPSSVGKASKDPESDHSNYYQTPMFTYKELEDATSGFDPAKELGDGGFGTVYKGKLKDGRVVAVKRLYENNCRRMQQFRNEIEILNRLRHHNLVTLYGCTPDDSPKLMLVYEFIPNGTVADHLHGTRAGERLLTWALRMSVAVETAEALAYLHAVQPQIVHRDVKTSNILLDGELHVKVADFGLSRLFPTPVATHVSTAPQGTPGYLDPEYHQCYHLTDKSDVYSFGVVLVELVTSMPAVDITRDRNEINLSNMALSRIPHGRIGEIVDPSLGYGSDAEVTRMVGNVAEIAFRCLQAERDMRPTMEEVLQSLRSIAAGMGPCGGMGAKAPPPKADDNGNNNRNVSVTVDEKRGRDDAYLLDSPPFSPDSDGAAEWPSRSTTPNASR